MSEASLLIIEGDPAMLTDAISPLKAAGYGIVVCQPDNDVPQLVQEQAPDICLLAGKVAGEVAGQPSGGDGIDLVRALRAESDVGIILMSDGADSPHRVAALESGADDCIAWPWDQKELLARVKNLLWRMQAQKKLKQKKGVAYSFENWTLDTSRRELTTPDGSQQRLSTAEFRLLLLLIENAGEVLSRNQLMQLVCNRDWHPGDRYIDILVGQVRQKFRQQDAQADFISTIHNLGYLFWPQVS